MASEAGAGRDRDESVAIAEKSNGCPGFAEAEASSVTHTSEVMAPALQK